jgi:hypothetical protein
VKDKGKGAENLIWLASRQSGRADPSRLAADDILAALTGRIAELEARVSEILAEVDPELPLVDSKQGGALSAPGPDTSRGTDKIRDARIEADAELARASEERRMLANEMRLLREAFQEARGSQLPAGLGANAAQAQIAPDLGAAIADEMRSLLTELLADFRARVLAPPPVQDVAAKSEATSQLLAAAPAPIVEEIAQDRKIASPLIESVATEITPPIETVESIVEHVDELVRPAPPLVDSVATEAAPPMDISDSIVEHVDELVRPTNKSLIDTSVESRQEPEPVAPADLFAVEAEPMQSASIVEDYEELFRSESPPPIDTVDFQVAAPDSAVPTVDEHVFEPTEPLAPIIDEYVDKLRLPEMSPLTEAFDAGPAPAEPIEPIIDEYVEELRRPEPWPPIETIHLNAAPTEPIEANIDEFIEELRWPEAPPPIETVELSAAPAEPIAPIVNEYVEELPREEFTVPSAPPSVPDPRLAALWDAAPLPTEAETAPPADPEPTSFITEDFIAETRPLDVPEAPYPPQNLAPETIEYAPPQEFPLPPVEFAPQPPAIVEPEPQAWPAEPLITQPEPAPSFSSMFPELTVADERGLHQIQVVISPIHSFPRLLETERRIRALSTVSALHLRDFRNGVATLTVAVSEAISPAEFGAVIQMLETLHLRLEGTTQSTVELHAEEEPPTS